MNLLWISHNIPYPPKTGVLQRNYNLLREASRHADIYLLAVFKSDILPGEYDLDSGTPRTRQAVPPDRDRAPADRDLSCRSVLEGACQPVHPGSAQRQLGEGRRHAPASCSELVESVQFDVVHFDTISLAAYRDEVGQRAEDPEPPQHRVAPAQAPDRFRVAIRSSDSTTRSRRNKLERYERRVCAEFDTNFTVSALDRERLLELVPSSQGGRDRQRRRRRLFPARWRRDVPGNLDHGQRHELVSEPGRRAVHVQRDLAAAEREDARV